MTLILDTGAAFTGDLPRPLEEHGVIYESWQRIRAFGVKMVYLGHGPAAAIIQSYVQAHGGLTMDDIRYEPARQHILRRPGFYIGHNQWDSAAVYALVGYIFELALDPRTLNACAVLTVKLEQTGMISIKDNGRGMPIPISQADYSKRERSFIDVLTWYVATGSYGDSEEYYERYGFLNYLGLVLSCVSESLKITTVWKGALYTVSCSRGEITLPLREIAKTSERGTHIVFLPDRELFSEFTFSPDTLISLLSQLSEKYPQVRIRFEDENTGTTIDFGTL